MTSVTFQLESPLRARHDEYAISETARRVAASATSGTRGSGESAHTAQVLWMPWGNTAEIVAMFDSVETEYASIRRGAALCDRPQRGTLEIHGSQRLEFLQRMLSQEMKGFDGGQTREAFWLNRKGRIAADLLLCQIEDRIVVDCAGAVAAETATALNGFIFSEDVKIADVTSSSYRIAIHGPKALHLLEQAGATAEAIESLHASASCAQTTIASSSCLLARADSCGVCGVEIFVARANALDVWNALLGVHDLLQGGQRRGRPCGWLAYNMARIEGGTPLFEVDFGSTSLPGETALLDRRVSFTKGCYLGQEIVARMNSLGKPKQIVSAFRMETSTLPVDGAQVFSVIADRSIGDEVGVVTSSTMSPMLGAACVGFATVRFAHSAAGTQLTIAAEGHPERAAVQAQLAFASVRATDASGTSDNLKTPTTTDATDTPTATTPTATTPTATTTNATTTNATTTNATNQQRAPS